MKKTINIAQFGLGPIGVECLKLAAAQPWVSVVGAVDIARSKVGTDLGALTGLKHLRGLRIVSTVEALEQKPDLVFHTAVSRFLPAYLQLEPIVKQGINVVSSCEELLFPRLREPKLAMQLDQVCRRSGARLVGTGVNPGFVMDFLPICLATVSQKIYAIHVHRVVDASKRREPLQRKIGSGLKPAEFQRRLKRGQAGHAGLRESLALVAHALGWKIDRIVETGEAVVARRPIRTPYLQVCAGQTCGLHQRAEAKINGQIRLILDLKMSLDAQNEHDAIRIEGDPPLAVRIERGVSGDQATVAALVNTAPRLLRAQPGLKLVTDLAMGPAAQD